MCFSAGETPKQEAVDSAKRERAGLGRRASAEHVIKQPCDFAGGEIWIEQEPRLPGNFLLVSGLPQSFAVVSGAPILPDNCIVNGFSGPGIQITVVSR